MDGKEVVVAEFFEAKGFTVCVGHAHSIHAPLGVSIRHHAPQPHAR